ncbi:MAG TPA: FAD-dependent oxidoreductase [Gaiellaceae bacterium]|nr:FAD-dependent oxidoreductase [Gaiellaceae bacterium]
MAATALPDELRPPLGIGEALVEADRCLACGEAHAPAPCLVACPAGVDVPAFVEALAGGDADGAARTILAANILGASCARVCPAEVLCQGACVLAEPIEIARLQRHALDRAPAAPARLRPQAEPSGFRVAVVGAGPAGMACAGELALLGHAVTLYDERPEPGGLVRYAIAPYRIEREPLPVELELLRGLGVELRLAHRVDEPELRALVDGADALFLGIGAGRDTDVRYRGDELAGVWTSLDFIEALKTGVPPQVGRRVAVVGGGNTAIDVAREALRLGADDVTLVYRRSRRELPAYPHEVEDAEAEGVHFQWLAAPTRILGDAHVTGLECVLMALGEPDESGRRRPAPIEHSEFVLAADTVVKAIGQRGHEHVAGLRLAHGSLVVDGEGRTSDPKVFAGGDAVNGGASAVEAVRAGRDAARAIDGWLRR